ncbi:hypothetical protein BCR43DRAFT_500705 [Syncephalastrum racemosum]|uniref:Uncharacterized protein n=1 Tax=Syncephalastrum racemosum TaxID=13706 RepID=A0A1X2HSZ0_SYNRA|nr:hypothetical protein BCR43DRAFT_500705 [Syncephalastrum racemosum]
MSSHSIGLVPMNRRMMLLNLPSRFIQEYSRFISVSSDADSGQKKSERKGNELQRRRKWRMELFASQVSTYSPQLDPREKSLTVPKKIRNRFDHDVKIRLAAAYTLWERCAKKGNTRERDVLFVGRGLSACSSFYLEENLERQSYSMFSSLV